MTKWKWYIPLSCLIVLHSPDGTELQLESNQLVAVRPVQKSHEQHLAPGIKTLIYMGGQKFGVTETHAEVDAVLKECR